MCGYDDDYDDDDDDDDDDLNLTFIILFEYIARTLILPIPAGQVHGREFRLQNRAHWRTHSQLFAGKSTRCQAAIGRAKLPHLLSGRRDDDDNDGDDRGDDDDDDDRGDDDAADDDVDDRGDNDDDDDDADQ